MTDTLAAPARKRARPNPDALAYSVPEVAALLSLGVSTTWNLIHAGELRAVKVGRGRYIVPRSELERWISEQISAAS